MDDDSRTTIATYDKTAPEYIRKVQKYAPEPEREKFMSLVKPGGKILNAGCGTLFLLLKEGEGERVVTSGTIEGDERFFTYYSVFEIRKLLGYSGFSVTEIYTWDQKDRNPERPPEMWITAFATK